MRKQTLLKSWLLLFAIIAGVGNVWGGTAYVDITPTQALNDGGVDPITIVCAKGDGTSNPAISSGQLRLYQASSGKTTGNTITFSSERTITKIEFTFANNMTADNGVFSEGDYDSESYTWTGSTNSVTLTVTGTKSGERIYITAMKVYYETDGATGPTLSITSSTIAVGATATISAPEELTVSYESSNESVATVNTAGVVTGVAAGEATITASWDATDTYNAGSKEFTIIVVETTTYEQVTSSDQLVAGNEYILVATENNMAMGTQNGKIRNNVEVTITGDKISIADEAVAILTLGGSTGAWTFLASDNNEYLALTANSNEIHSSNDATLNTSKWIITDDFQIESTAQSDTRYIRYNSGSPRFACYKSGQVEAYLFVKSGSATDTKQDPGFSFSETSVEATLGEEFTAPTFSNPNNVTVTYASSDETVATISTEGIVTIVAAGTTTISATSQEDDTYKAGTASYTLTVTDPNAPGTENNPYTVAGAIAATPTSGNVYIKGIVSAFYNESIVGDDSNYRYYISDDGTTDNQLLVYKGKGLNNVAFSDAGDLLVGDEVVILGSLTMYQNAPEVAANNYIVSLNRPEDTTPKITVAETEINVDAAEHEGTISVTYKNVDTELVEIKFCDAEGVDATYNWIIADFDSGKNIEYVIDANDGEERTAYLKVYGLDGDANDVYSNVITITQAAYVAPPMPVNGYYEKVTSTADITDGQYLIVYEGGVSNGQNVPSVAFNGNLQTLDAVENGIAVTIADNQIAATDVTRAAEFTINVTVGTLQNASGLYIGVSSNSNGLRTSDDPEAYTHTFSIDDNEDAVIAAAFSESSMSLRYNYASNQLRFRYYKDSGQQPIQLYKFVSSNTVTASVSEYKWATFSSEYDLDFTDVTAVEAHIVRGANGSTIVTEKVEGTVAAGTGLLLYSETPVENVEIPVAEEAGMNYSNKNKLIAVTEDNTTIEKAQSGFTNYVLAVQNEKAVFAYIDEVPATLNKGKAYLMLEGDAPAPFLGFDGEDTTGINSVERGALSVEECYTLDGRRVAQPTKGLYIVNGKKVMVK